MNKPEYECLESGCFNTVNNEGEICNDCDCDQNNLCSYCYADLDFHMAGDREEPYCEMCGMDL